MFVGGRTAGHLPRHNFAHIIISRHRDQVICSCLCCFVYPSFLKQRVERGWGGGLPGKPWMRGNSSLVPSQSEHSLLPLCCFAGFYLSFLTGSYFSRMLQASPGTCRCYAFPPAFFVETCLTSISALSKVSRWQLANLISSFMLMC